MQTVRAIALRWASLLLAAAGAVLILTPLHAQERATDTRAPLVEVDVLPAGTADEVQTFSARVTDDRTLDAVTLHYRRAGAVPFERAAMSALDGGNRFGVALPTDPEDLRDIEYYVQALDESGNRTVSGFAFDPLVRRLSARDPALTAAPATTDGRPPAVSSGGTRWWALALGVLAVGAFVSLSGDDGGGGDTVPLTIDLPEPDAR